MSERTPVRNARPLDGVTPPSKLWFTPIVLALILVFALPPFFPPPMAASDSFCFGFNNHLAQLLFGLALVLTAFLAWRRLLPVPSPDRPATGGTGDLTGSLIAWCLAISAVLCAAMWWLTSSLGGIRDSPYYLDRINLILRGQVPVRDFEFLYGTGPLYASIAISRLLHISANSGYFLLWACASLLGILLLWLSIRWLELPAGGKRTVFLFAFIVMAVFITDATLNYCSLRYTLSLFAVVGLARIDRDAHFRTRAGVVLFATFMTALLLAYSPEQGLVYALAVCAFLPVRRYLAKRAFLPDLFILMALLTGPLWFAARIGTFATMKRFGAGAFNFPVYPGPHILFAFAAMLILIVYLARGPVRQHLQSNVAFAAFYSIGMLPGALGRCDTTHIVGYLLPAILCGMLLAWRWTAAWRAVRIGFPTFFIILPFLLGLWLFPPTLTRAFLSHLYRDGAANGRIGREIDHLATHLAMRVMGSERGEMKMASLRNASGAASLDPRQIFPGASAILEAPLEYMPNKVSNYQAPWIDEGYFLGVLNVLTPTDVQRKIDELEAHPANDLIVSNEDFDQCGPQGGDRQLVGGLLLLPWVPQPKTHVMILVPYCTYLRAHYSFVTPPTSSTLGYGLMRRKSGDPN